jgi:hypothetical protein
METKTLRELNEWNERYDNDLCEEKPYIEYDEGSDYDDLFVEMEIVNPHDSQHTFWVWVPVDMVPYLEAQLIDPELDYREWLETSD